MADASDRPAYMPTPLAGRGESSPPEPSEPSPPPERILPPPRPFYIPDEDETASAAPGAALIALSIEDLPVSEIAAALAPHWRKSPVEAAREIARSEGLLWETDDLGAVKAAAASLRSLGIPCEAIDLTDTPASFEPEVFEGAHIHADEAVFVCAEMERRFPLASVRAILTCRLEAPLLAKPPLEAHVVLFEPPRILTGSDARYTDRHFASADAFARRLAERSPHAVASFDRDFPDEDRLRRHRHWLMLRSVVADQGD